VNIVIVGCGRVGATLASRLSQQKNTITIIDLDDDAFRRLDKSFRGETLIGDGTDQEILRRAGIEDAQAFVAVTNGDNRNIMAAQIAQHIFHTPTVVCRIYDPKREEIYRALGLTVISPTTIGAESILEKLHEATQAATAQSR